MRLSWLLHDVAEWAWVGTGGRKHVVAAKVGPAHHQRVLNIDMIAYLDIDGVLLRSTDGAVWDTNYYEIAPHAVEFLRWAVGRYDCRWLTARDRRGSHEGIILAFQQALGTSNLPPDLLDLVLSITPQPWTGSKTSGIDLHQSDFIWVDDNPSTQDLLMLERAGCSGRWIEVNSDVNPHDLLRVMAYLESFNPG